MPDYLLPHLFSKWITAISVPLTPLSPLLSAWMAAYEAVPLAPLDVSAGSVSTSEQLTTIIISFARDEADILLGVCPLLLRTPLPSALALPGPSALPSAATIDAEQIHHGGGAMQQIKQFVVVRLQAVARGLLAWRRLQEIRR
jgi:hypothetical protein